MTTKLTLTIEERVITQAKIYAQKKGRSLSSLVENYLVSLDTKDNQEKGVSPRVKRLRGAIRLPADFDYKKNLEAELSKKYNK